MGTRLSQAKPTANVSDQERGLKFARFFTRGDVHSFDEVEWEVRVASIQNEKGETIFEQREVEVPKQWSQTATNIVASKYFHGRLGTPERERSIKQVISRVADTIAQWGTEGGYFRGDEDAKIFHEELTHILVEQKASFNSPVWFNCGLWQKYRRSQDGHAWYWDRATGEVKQETVAYRHSVQPASSTPSKTTSRASSIWRRPRACSSNMVPGQARTSRPCGPPSRDFLEAALPPALFRS